MLERVYINEQIDQLTRDLLNERAQVEHLQATIADLQGKVAGAEKAYQEKARLWIEQTGAVSALQQRVAQLEAMLAEEHPGLDEVCDKLAILQADHARVLQVLVELVPVAENLMNGLECDHDVGICCCGDRRTIAEARASLPAQPAACTRIGGCLKEQGFHCCCEDGTCD